jgi:uncharacterized Zn finger protein
VASSNGRDSYRVYYDGSSRTCTCPGFHYRRNCRHVRELNAALRALATVPSEREAS